MKHVVLYSGGHSSALAAIETVRRYGPENTILLNHDINPRTEDADIKRFKREVAEYLGLLIAYANMADVSQKIILTCASNKRRLSTGCNHLRSAHANLKWSRSRAGYLAKIAAASNLCMGLTKLSKSVSHGEHGLWGSKDTDVSTR